MKHDKPHFTIELNRDASAPLVAVTLALFIGTAAILIRLFTHM